MFVKATNGQIDKYPYSIGELRRDNPNTSFPRNIPSAMLAEWDVFSVTITNRPKLGHTKNVVEGTPVLQNDQWVQVWGVTDASAEEIEQRTEAQAQSVRDQRNTLLADSDWTQTIDAPVDQTAWATYRLGLRDITSHANFPYITEEDWPVAP